MLDRTPPTPRVAPSRTARSLVQLTSPATPSIVALLVALGSACGGGSSNQDTPAASQASEPTQGAETMAEPEPPPIEPLPEPEPPAPEPVFALTEGLSTPESVLYDLSRDVYYVSNIEGSPFAVDDNGYISKLSSDGSMLEPKWIDGASDKVTLNAPKGMTIAGKLLYVADIDHVRIFDLETGKAKGQVKVPGATFLNDLATADDGTVYVTDSGLKEGFDPSGTDAIYAIDKRRKLKPVVKDAELGGPNGLTVVGDQLWVVTFRSGEIYSVARKDGARGQAQQVPDGQLDGVIALPDGRLLVASWGKKSVLAGTPGGAMEPVLENLESPADIGLDTKRGRVLVPLFMKNQVLAYAVPE